MYQSVDRRLTRAVAPLSQKAQTRPRESRDFPAYSIFHEPWWLDCVAPGAWREVQVTPGDGATGRWPFYLRRRCGLLISTQPPLTRTLGPVLRLASGSPIPDLRRRVRLTDALIDQLPRTHLFQQTFDPRINEAIAFRMAGFSVDTAYTFRIEPARTADEAWNHMTDKTRNVIRRATEQTDVISIDEPEQFCDFYETNLATAGRPNMYGAATMRRLTTAFITRARGELLGARSAEAGLVAAIALVWDAEATYFLLSSRSPTAHSGAISLLLWHAIQRSLLDKRGFDFDGIASPSILQFLSGFGGTLASRLVVQRSSSLYDGARLFRRVLGWRRQAQHPI
jgi:Acetyltransferase (GNAT) domain